MSQSSQPPSADEAELLKSLPQIALKKIRALCRGNGAEPDSVQIKAAEGRIIDCEALTHLEISSEFEDESKRGAHQVGQSFEDGATMEQEIQNYLGGLIKNGQSRSVMVDTIKKSPGQGFASHAEYFDMDAFNKDYSFQQACGSCGGQAMTTCTYCNGQAKERCSKCHGQTMMTCTYCQGSGTTQNSRGEQEQCRQCAGRRQIPCTVCRRTGVVPCRGCRGTGQLKCKTCDGAGIFTYIRHVIVKMKTLFEVDRAELPHPAVKIIEDAGSRMVDRSHVKLTQVEKVSREDGGLAIQYVARFPYGDLNFTVNGKDLKAHLFGFKGKLLKLPKFLETMTEKSTEHLELAAANSQKAVYHIRKAAGSRLIANAILYTAMMPRKKAMMAIKKKFSMGVGNQFIQTIVALSDKALKNSTQKARISGHVLISGLFALLFAGHLIALKPVLSSVLQQEILGVLVDLIVVGVVGYCGFMLLGKLISNPLKKALSQILSDKQRATFKPKTQANIFVCLGLSLVMFLVVSIIGAVTGIAPTPFWLPL